MTLRKGNKAIANHAVDGKDLLLFDMLGGGGVRFRGPFSCAGYSFEDSKDSSGKTRLRSSSRLTVAGGGVVFT